ncbi:MAG: DMSO/selenate family reductase complex B subunit [Melioribacteraceae bacterium]
MKKQFAFHFDASRCSGCKTCQVACKDKNNLEVGRLWRRVYEVNLGNWNKKGNAWINNVTAYNMSISCNHCEDPICVKVCPTSAMHKSKDGLVLVDESKCMGCRYCEWACPYGAPQYDENGGVMSKCNFCADYLEEDKSPACVAACPMRVLDFGELKEMQKRYGNIDGVFPLPKGEITKPNFVITPHKNSVGSENALAAVNNEEEV